MADMATETTRQRLRNPRGQGDRLRTEIADAALAVSERHRQLADLTPRFPLAPRLRKRSPPSSTASWTAPGHSAEVTAFFAGLDPLSQELSDNRVGGRRAALHPVDRHAPAAIARRPGPQALGVTGTVDPTMKTKAMIAEKLTVPVAAAWDAVRGFGRLDVWFPGLAACRVEGDGVGAHRYLQAVNGGHIHDILRSVDQESRRLTYERVESPLPVTSYSGTVEVLESFDQLAVVVWTVDFESAAEASENLRTTLEAVIGAGLRGMKADLAGNQITD
jgi:hypothetical protein